MTGSQIVIALVAVLAGALVKSVTGTGFPLVAIPVMTLFVPVQDAVAVVAVPNVILNAVLCWAVRDARAQSRDLPVLGVVGILGAIAGTFVLVNMPERPLLIGLAAVIGVYVAFTIVLPDASLSPVQGRRWAVPVGAIAGVMQGAVGISGPVVSTWMHAYRLPRDAYVFSVTMLFLLSGSAQVIVLGLDGELTTRRLLVASAATPLVLAMIPIGARLRSKLATRGFDRVVLFVLAGSAVSLLAQVLR